MDAPPGSTAPGNGPEDGSVFYVTGGTMVPRAASYVEREADHELFEAIRSGEFCYVLTSRQMGKSSLFSRVAYRLRQEGVSVSFFELSAVGTNVTASEWYDGMLREVGKDLKVRKEINKYRKENPPLGPHQMWREALLHVVLPNVPGPITIIVDEIDLVRSLPFATDEFFIGIRELYNRRSQEPELNRLCFCLLGVAAPADLIANKQVTPFNIGRRIELRDFTEEETMRLADGMRDMPPHQAAEVVRRVYHWTRGQPYLSQKLCEAVASQPGDRNAAAVDAITKELFLTQRARETEPNLTFVRDRIIEEKKNGQACERLLRLYQDVLGGGRVEDSEMLPEVTKLKLSGLVRGQEGTLEVKNPIYRTNFNEKWVGEQMPRNWLRVAAKAALALAAVLLVACLPVAMWALHQARAEKDAEWNAEQATKEAKVQQKRAEDAENKLAASDAKRAKAVAEAYNLAITDLWKSGRRFVAAAFLEWSATDPNGEEKLNDPDLKLPPIDQFLGLTLNPAPGGNGADPDSWVPGAGRESWLEPDGTAQFPDGHPVTKIIPWPAGPEMLLVRQNEDSSVSVYPWDLSGKSTGSAFSNPAPIPLADGTSAAAIAACPMRGLIAAAVPDPDDGSESEVTVNQITTSGSSPSGSGEEEQTISADELAGKGAPQIGAKPKRIVSMPPRAVHLEAEPGNADKIVTALAFSAYGRRLAVGFQNGDVALLTGTCEGMPGYQVKRWPGVLDSTPVTYLAFISKGSELAVAGTDNVCICREVDHLDSNGDDLSNPVAPIEPSPDGTRAAGAASDGTQWGDATGVSNAQDAGAKAAAFAWSPDNLWEVAGLVDGSITLVHNGNMVETAPAFSGPVVAVAFLPDESEIVASDTSGLVRAWRLLDKPLPLLGTAATPAAPAEDPKQDWQLQTQTPTDYFHAVAKPVPTGDLRGIACDGKLAAAMESAGFFGAYVDDSFTHSPSLPSQSDLMSRAGALGDLQSYESKKGAGSDSVSDWALVTHWLKSSQPPDANTATEILAMPDDYRWALLGEKINDWGPQLQQQSPGLYAQLWLGYAAALNTRLENEWVLETGSSTSDEPDQIDVTAFRKPWRAEYNNAIDAVRQAYAVSIPDSDTTTLDFLLKNSAFSKLSNQLQQVQGLESGLDDPDSALKERASLQDYENYVKTRAPDSYHLTGSAAWDYESLGDYPDAERAYAAAGRAAGSQENQADLLLIRAALEEGEANGTWPEVSRRALDDARQATVAAPDWDRAWQMRATYETRSGGILPDHDEVQAAIDDLKKAISLESGDDAAETYSKLPEYYIGLDDPQSAREAITKCLSLASSLNIYDWFWTGWTSYNETEREWAWDRLQDGISKAQKADKDDILANLLWDRAGARSNWDWDHPRREWDLEPSEAVGDYLEALGLRQWGDNDRADLLENISIQLSDIGLGRDAERMARDAMLLTGSDTFSENAYGLALWDERRFPEMVQVFQKCVKLETGRFTSIRQIDAENLLTALHCAGRDREALQREAEFEDLPLEADRLKMKLLRARLLASLADDPATPPDEAAADRKEMDQVLTSATSGTVFANQTGLIPEANYIAETAALLRLDEGASRRTLDLEKKPWPKCTSDQFINEATIDAFASRRDPARRDDALAAVAQALEGECIDLDDVDAYYEFKPLQDLPEWAEVNQLMAIKESDTQAYINGDSINIAGVLGDRDLRLAKWLEGLKVQSPDAQITITAAAKALEDADAKEQANPVVIDWTKIEQAPQAGN
jgi:hypothetical protein